MSDGRPGFIDEFADGVLKELDYRDEACFAIRMADNMASIACGR